MSITDKCRQISISEECLNLIRDTGAHTGYLPKMAEILAKRVLKVLELHAAEITSYGDEETTDCIECSEPWPCPTVRALENES